MTDAEEPYIRQWVENGVYYNEAFIGKRLVQACSGLTCRLVAEALAFELLKQLAEALRHMGEAQNPDVRFTLTIRTEVIVPDSPYKLRGLAELRLDGATGQCMADTGDSIGNILRRMAKTVDQLEAANQ